MKSLIVLVLTVVAAQAAAPESPLTVELHYPDISEIASAESPESRALARNNLDLGNPNGNYLLYRNVIGKAGVPGQYQVLQATFRTNSNIRIYAFQAHEVGASQGATVSVVAGGIGQASLEIRIVSALGRGYIYELSVYGR